MNIFNELDLVVLRHDLEANGLKAGDIGTIVHCYPGNQAFEVEFITAEGKTIAVLTLTSKDIRPRAQNEILHVRAVAPAIV
jgi:hypothetical protein